VVAALLLFVLSLFPALGKNTAEKAGNQGVR